MLVLTPLAFGEDLADAVGPTEDDVQSMLKQIQTRAPFNEDKRERALNLLKVAFNRLRFPCGSPLYHTALVKGAMNMLLAKRRPKGMARRRERSTLLGTRARPSIGA